MTSAFDRFVLGRTDDAREENNLALLRFAAAGAVLFAHSWPIALGAAALDPVTVMLRGWFGDGVAVSSAAVQAFFVISGYLVTRSAQARGGVGAFARARALRIYPALAVNVALSAVVLGALVTSLPLRDYFADGQFWKFLANNVFCWNVIYRLPGVFEGHPLSAVNGSLWTLPLEIRCYVAIGLLLGLGVLKRAWLFIPIALAVVIGDGIFRDRGLLGADAAATCYGFFLLGAVLFVARRIAPPSPVLGSALLALAAAAPVEAIARLAAMTGWAMVVLWAGLAAPRIPWPEKIIGDPSYGIYIYAFPVQQLVVLTLGADAPWLVAGVAGAATLALAILSWKLIEAPALTLKNRRAAFFIRRPRAAPTPS